jgi:hypothetical protein
VNEPAGSPPPQIPEPIYRDRTGDVTPSPKTPSSFFANLRTRPPFSSTTLGELPPPSRPAKAPKRGRSTEPRKIIRGIIQARPGVTGGNVTSPTAVVASDHTSHFQPELPGASPTVGILARYGNVAGGAGGPAAVMVDQTTLDLSTIKDGKKIKRRRNRKHHDEHSSDSEKGGRGKVHRRKEPDDVKVFNYLLFQDIGYGR